MVPSSDANGEADELTSEEATESLNLMVDRIHDLERQRALDDVRLEKISEQLVLIQTAIDHVMDIIQDAHGAAPEEGPE